MMEEQKANLVFNKATFDAFKGMLQSGEIQANNPDAMFIVNQIVNFIEDVEELDNWAVHVQEMS